MSLIDLKPGKSGGLLLAGAVFVGGFLKLVIPAGVSPASGVQSKPAAQAPESAASKQQREGFRALLAQKIKEFYGCAGPNGQTSSDDLAHWNVPPSSRSSVRFVIAFVPDPVHTHLSLLFDRAVNAMELAVQDQGYAFDRSILPWKIPQQNDGSSKSEKAASESRSERELFPGLLIFRKAGNSDSAAPPAESSGCPPRDSLFVFLVAETPTSGIRATQFQNALTIMRGIREGSAPGAVLQPETLFLLGPNFSGSLDSLARQLWQLPPSPKFSSVVAYSGSVSGADSMGAFQENVSKIKNLRVRFASFQENDDYAIQKFARFAFCRGYAPEEIAILAEDDTVYGAQQVVTDSPSNHTGRSWLPACNSTIDDISFKSHFNEIVHLHFPREISFFRYAYEKELAAQTQPIAKIPGKTTLPNITEEQGSDDDAVAPYANGQTTLSQEAVMMGVVSELQKHHIKFTILLATNPADQVFLARYLRSNYPQGRVVVTSPDLLFTSQEDTLLYGVLGLNTYSLVPGISDSLCRLQHAYTAHVDRLFDSSTSIGIYNSMLGLTSFSSLSSAEKSFLPEDLVPHAAYADYTSPKLSVSGCLTRPLLWLTIVGRDGYWPMAGFSEQDPTNADHDLPIVLISEALKKKKSTLPLPQGDATPVSVAPHHTRTSWNLTYSICLALMFFHALLSLKGSYLSNSESRAQFTRSHDRYGVAILTIGGFLLAICFVLILCTRNPLINWAAMWPRGMRALLWLPLPVFVGITVYDVARLRNQPLFAWIFLAATFLATVLQIALSFGGIPYAHYLWSNRLIHFSSGVSPVLPFILLLASGYWWTWLSLRSVALVDLRRPRLPNAGYLPPSSVRISDTEGEAVRQTAHPLKVGWRITGLLAGVILISFTALDWKHPLQSLEGHVYDLGYFATLILGISVFLGCLMRLVFTWFDYKQVLSGLDRSPLREAFSRMKRLSWRSMWNPGGSTLRETYRVMSRTLENMVRLKQVLEEKKQKTADEEAVFGQIAGTLKKVSAIQRIFRPLFPPPEVLRVAPANPADGTITEIENSLGMLEAALSKYNSGFVQCGKSPLAAVSAIERVQCTQGKLTVAVEKFRVLNEKNKDGKIMIPDSANGFFTKIESAKNGFASAVKQLNDFTGAAKDTESFGFEDLDKSQNALFEVLDKFTANLSKIKENKSPLKSPDICEEDRATLLTGLVDSLEVLQKQLANTAGLVLKNLLEPFWSKEKLPAISEDERIKRPELEITRAIAEEFVVLVYINFLQSVLLQMRTLVICAGGMYVFILCSITVYPFEPHPALQILEVALLAVMAAAVGFVYAEMHRDSILSRLTSTTPGELGWDFWFKFVSAGAIPVFSLIAVQFPEISRFLFSWLEPALQALK